MRLELHNKTDTLNHMFYPQVSQYYPQAILAARSLNRFNTDGRRSSMMKTRMKTNTRKMKGEASVIHVHLSRPRYLPRVYH